MDKTKAIIVDIDGTLANVEHRRPLLLSDPPDWKSFNYCMPYDTVNEWCRELIKKMAETDSYGYNISYEILFVSGRSEDFREDTTKWLRENELYSTKLLMRPSGDFRKDDIVKQEIYDTHIKEKYNILFAIDDRQSVVDMWRRNGIVCLQCAPGDF